MGGGNLRLVRAQVLCTSVVAISALTSGVHRTRLLPSPFPARFKWPGGGICRHALRPTSGRIEMFDILTASSYFVRGLGPLKFRQAFFDQHTNTL